MIETEIKLRIRSAEDLARIARALPEPLSVRRQVNHYYDTPDREIQARLAGMFRVRRENDVWLACAKLGARLAADGTLQSTEIEVPWLPPPDWQPTDTQTLWASDLKPIRKLRDELGVADVVYLGAMKNERTVHAFGEVWIELDRLTLPDGTPDYELELETDHPEVVRPELEALLRRVNVPVEPQTRTKFERFLRTRRA